MPRDAAKAATEAKRHVAIRSMPSGWTVQACQKANQKTMNWISLIGEG